MKYTKLITGLIVFFLFGIFQTIAQVDIITAKEFKSLLKSNKDLVIIDASKTKKYTKSHVKNAIHVNHKDLDKKGEIKGLFKSPEDLAAYFGNLGISETSEIVIYDSGLQKYASKVYLLLKYIGAQNVKILHKDKESWAKSRITVTAAKPEPLPAVTFTPTVNDSFIVDINFVKEHQNDPNTVIVDLRAEDQYKGIDEKKRSEGHIPGAIHCFYKDLEIKGGAFKSKEEIEKIFTEKGITSDKTIIMYCNTGVIGSVGFVIAKNVMGFENVKLYDGSYKEWIVDNPVEK